MCVGRKKHNKFPNHQFLFVTTSIPLICFVYKKNSISILFKRNLIVAEKKKNYVCVCVVYSGGGRENENLFNLIFELTENFYINRFL